MNNNIKTIKECLDMLKYHLDIAVLFSIGNNTNIGLTQKDRDFINENYKNSLDVLFRINDELNKNQSKEIS